MSKRNKTSIAGSNSGRINRRRFMAGAGAAALSFTIVKPESVRGAAANSKVNLGLIGCGGRGTWIAELFKQHGGYNVVAVADYFQDRIDNAGEKAPGSAANAWLAWAKSGLAIPMDRLGHVCTVVALSSR